MFRTGGPYQELLSEFDRVQLPRLVSIKGLSLHVHAAPAAEQSWLPQQHAAGWYAGSLSCYCVHAAALRSTAGSLPPF